MSTKEQVVTRHSFPVRVAHWLVVLSFLLLAISGLGLFFPSLNWMTSVLGSPQLAQFLHPVFGVVMVLGMVVLFFGNVAHAFPEKGDGQWMMHMVDVLKGHEHEVAEVGQYNAGQKMLFWTIIGLLAILLVTGIIVWQPYFAPFFAVSIVRLCLFLHSLCAVLLIMAIFMHAYMGFWYKGTLRGMVYGTVTRSWAKLHHPRWLRQLEGKKK